MIASHRLLRPVHRISTRACCPTRYTILQSLLRQPPQIRYIEFKMATAESPSATADSLSGREWVAATQDSDTDAAVQDRVLSWKPRFVDVSSNAIHPSMLHTYTTRVSCLPTLPHYKLLRRKLTRVAPQIGINLTDPVYTGLYHGTQRHENDLSAVVQRAKDIGCEKLIVTGSDLEHSKDAIRLAAEYRKC